MAWKAINQAVTDGDIPPFEVVAGPQVEFGPAGQVVINNAGSPPFVVNLEINWPGNPFTLQSRPRIRISSVSYAAVPRYREGWHYNPSAFIGADVIGDWAQFANMAPPGPDGPVEPGMTVDQFTPSPIEIWPWYFVGAGPDDPERWYFSYFVGDSFDPDQGEYETQLENSEFLLEVWVEDAPAPGINYNCQCEDPNPSRTLAELRRALLMRVGKAAQTANPGPGMNDMLTDFLQSSQRMLYRQYHVLRTERFFTWNMEVGQRFYDVDANNDLCPKKLDPRQITWVGLSDGDDNWRPLICGIPPECYTRPNIVGWPERYEIRQCIEVWPAPSDANLRLRIKGHFGLEPFEADGDRCTVDDEAVLLHALARVKAHMRQPDAKNYEQDAMNYIRFLTAGAHQTRRYVPGDREYIAPAPPLWIPKEQ